MLSLLSGLLHAQDTVADFFIVKLHLAPEPAWPFPPVLTSGFPVRGEEASMAAIVNDLSEYLKTSPYIDWKHELVLDRAARLRAAGKGELEWIAGAYRFVRDEISHSWDAQDKRVTVSASDVLREKTGICWAKANLLAALLRACGIPAGICYQRLTLENTPGSGYCIHALNAVFLQDPGRWIRLDARGNKEGIRAEMDLEKERLAFRVRPKIGEADYPEIYAEPLQLTMDVLENSTDALYMYLHSLPGEI